MFQGFEDILIDMHWRSPSYVCADDLIIFGQTNSTASRAIKRIPVRGCVSVNVLGIC